ncbi:hypothetical protein P9E76_01710 [Schinkia azotoformans]|uniref:Uncharacterized protein n=1 Tax=Schinkia azotoformans LMG 9581 TaxID=1131731 RepID=K6DHQ4_SCHAZ|nr:hypothetical protein [Schinkia azotoformans]EKN67844.1 hypothetical protein BAZO_08179 [Schinkia azotoformans LMG 9581]MEC1637390.1 hypothetical protein [Schinkia azotoformans]MEC1943794.1 hypothetical protein [Schinkia azotoformans]
MNIHNKVLPADRNLAYQLEECSIACLRNAYVYRMTGDRETAARWMEEARRCERDLDKLIQKKQERDRLEEVVKDLKARGILCEIVRRSIG